MDQRELTCGGQACLKCGACRDWYLNRNNDDIMKRNDASCHCDYMFRHDLVTNPYHCNNEYYPLQNLICMCKDNY